MNLIQCRRASAKHARSLNEELGLDLDADVEGQGRDADGAARVLAAEDLAEQLGGTVDDAGLTVEVGARGHEAHDLDDAREVVDAARDGGGRCQGVEGAYSQQACDKLFQHPSVFFCATFDKVFSAIEQGLCQYGVLPLENSTAGSVNAVYDLMQKHNFSIVRSVRLRVDHSLLALPGAKLSEIR